ncbi:MAG: YkgJ family cysteine cluster protein, partial [Gammaproteobacteria bacterium]
NELKKINKLIKKNAKSYEKNYHNISAERIPCAFLKEDNHCGIHPVRPLRCRGFFSLSKKSCDEHYYNPALEVKSDPFSMAWLRAVHGIFSNHMLSLGLDSNYYELHSAVAIALENPHALLAWWNKKDIFKSALNTKAKPQILWVAPQENGEIVNFELSHQKKINIKILT